MDSLEAKASAERWLEEHKSGFRLSPTDEKENKLVFKSKHNQDSFHIICGSKSDEWCVCSEDGHVLQKLQDAMEYIDSKENLNVEMILTEIGKSIPELSGRLPAPDTKGASKKESEMETDASDDDDFEDAEDDEDAEDNDDEGFDCYYEEEDIGVEDEQKKEDEDEDDDEDLDNFFAVKGASPASIQRLTKDLKSITKQGDKYGFSAGPRGNNLFKWDVKLINIPTDSTLGKDLQQYAMKYKREAAISMEMQFPGDYPFSPPFLRVIRPRFKFLTGHVTIGGSICMEMLTKSGWRPCNDIEGILVQVRSEILSDPKASLDSSRADNVYSEAEAKEAFQRMVERYGWK